MAEARSPESATASPAKRLSSGASPGRDARIESAIENLAHPLHLVAACLDRGHYHFGLFEEPRTSVSDAQESLAEEIACRIPDGGRALDAGCGLGGTSRLLARHGHETLGIDPCLPAIEYARIATDGSLPVRFAARSLQAEMASSKGERFDAVVMIEVLQHLPPLDELLRSCCALVRPGGSIVVADVVSVPRFPWNRFPVHQVGDVERASQRAGLRCDERLDLTERARPSPVRFVAELERAGARLRRRFAPARPRLDAELAEVAAQCLLLDEGFRDGVLRYELTVLRRPARA